jgi:hypothetical protein
MLKKLTVMGNKHIYTFILLMLIALHFYMNYVILKKSELCLVYDIANRIMDGLNYYKIIFLLPNKIINIQNNILTLSGQAHPPFLGIIEAIVCKLLIKFNGEINVNHLILYTNTFFLSILIISTYGIGSIVYNKDIGLLSSFLVSFFPIINASTRTISIDFASAAMVTLSFYLLFKTKGFQSLKYSILLGIILGFALLTKEGFLTFLPFPFMYYIYKSYKLNQKKSFSLNLALCLFFVLIIVGSVYLYPGNLSRAFKAYTGYAFFTTKASILFYFSHYIIYTGTYLGIAFIPLLISYLMGLRFKDKVIFLWFVVPLIIFSFVPAKTVRFLILICPAFALIVAQELFNSKLFSKIKIRYACFLILLAMVQYFVYCSDLKFVDPVFYRMKMYGGEIPGMLTYEKNAYYPTVSKLLEIFKKEKMGKNKGIHTVFFLFGIGDIHCSLRYRLELKGLDIFNVACPMEGNEIDAPKPGTVDWQDMVLKADYIVDMRKKVETVELRGALEDVASIIREGFRKYKNNFKKISEFEIFDGSRVYVYRNLDLD